MNEGGRGLDRRELLAGLAGVGGSVLAGCATIRDRLAGPLRLVAVEVANWGDRSHEFRVRLRRGDATVFEESRDLAARGDDWAESMLWATSREWGDISQYDAAISVDGGPWRTLDPEDETKPRHECARLDADVVPGDGHVSAYYQPWPCPEE
jgi:hypothetical protein